MAEGNFVTVINCMDGRTQLPMIEWAMEHFSVDFVDNITEPGPDGILSDGPEVLVGSIMDRAIISVKKHGSRNIVIVSHADCAGNPVEKTLHLEQLERSVERVRSWGLDAGVHGVWLGEDWVVQKVF